MRKADNLPPSCAFVTKYGNLNFLEPSGPLRACNGTALRLYRRLPKAAHRRGADLHRLFVIECCICNKEHFEMKIRKCKDRILK